MKLSFASVERQIYIQYGMERLVFDALSTSKRRPEDDPYREINQIIHFESDEFHSTLASIYKDALTLLSVPNGRVDVEQLVGVIRRLTDLVSFEKIEYLCRLTPVIKVPAEVKEAYDPSDRNKTLEKTYTVNDYVQLGHLIILTRFVAPIWNMYTAVMEENYRANKWFNWSLFSMLNRSQVHFHDSVMRLYEYVRAWELDESRKLQLAAMGISTIEFPDWLVAEFVVVRLPYLKLDCGTGRGYVKDLFKETAANTQADTGRARIDLKDQTSHGDSESNQSRIECYKTKHDVSIGEVAVLHLYCKDPVTVAQRICHDIDPALVRERVAMSRMLVGKEIVKPQVYLLEWVLGHYITCKATRYLNNPTVCDMLGVTSAVLHHRGFPELGLVACSEGEFVDCSNLPAQQGIPNQQQKALIRELYPISPRTGSKMPPPGTNIFATIEVLDASCRSFAWINPSRAPNQALIRAELVNLIITIGSRLLSTSEGA